MRSEQNIQSDNEKEVRLLHGDQLFEAYEELVARYERGELMDEAYVKYVIDSAVLLIAKSINRYVDRPSASSASNSAI